MHEADFDSNYEFTGFKEVNRDTKSMYLKARLAEQSDRRRLLEMLNEGIIPKLIGMHLKMELTRYPDSLTADIRQLKELVNDAIKNAHTLTNEISPHVLIRVGLKEALHELLRGYADKYRLSYYINARNTDFDLISKSTSLILFNLLKNLASGFINYCDADMIGINLQINDDMIDLVIQDNGSFSDDFKKIVATGQSREHQFLFEAAEQAYSLGGKLWIDKTIGMRTICVSIPLSLTES